MLISVIVPAYNQAKFLAEALESVLAQTYTNWECIIINDGSTDETETIAGAFADRDHRFKYLKKENGGLSSARNAGLKIANGKWVQFLDSDDHIAPQKFELSLALIDKTPGVDLVVTDFKMFVDDINAATPGFREIKQEHLNFKDILFGWDNYINIPIHCGLFNIESFKPDPFNEQLKCNEDWVMWLDLFGKNINAQYLDQPLGYYRINPNSMTKDRVFARLSLVETYKHIISMLPQQYAVPFACNVLDRYKNEITSYENDLFYFKNRAPYKLEKKIRKFLSPLQLNKNKPA